MGIWGRSHAPTPTIQNVIVADAQKGLVWSTIGPSPMDHTYKLNRLTILDSAFVGRSRAQPYCGKQYGLILPVTGSQGSISPEQCGPTQGPQT